MLSHLFRSGVRALAISVLIGGFLIFATGGLASPYVTPLVGVGIAALFIFWIAFACFGRRSYSRDRLRDDARHGDGGAPGSVSERWIRGEKRTDEGIGEGGEGGSSGGGDGD